MILSPEKDFLQLDTRTGENVKFKKRERESQVVFAPCSGHSELLSKTMDTFKEKELNTITQGSSFL